jgi:hypothetical protein
MPDKVKKPKKPKAKKPKAKKQVAKAVPQQRQSQSTRVTVNLAAAPKAKRRAPSKTPAPAKASYTPPPQFNHYTTSYFGNSPWTKGDESHRVLQRGMTDTTPVYTPFSQPIAAVPIPDAPSPAVVASAIASPIPATAYATPESTFKRNLDYDYDYGINKDDYYSDTNADDGEDIEADSQTYQSTPLKKSPFDSDDVINEPVKDDNPFIPKSTGNFDASEKKWTLSPNGDVITNGQEKIMISHWKKIAGKGKNIIFDPTSNRQYNLRSGKISRPKKKINRDDRLSDNDEPITESFARGRDRPNTKVVRSRRDSKPSAMASVEEEEEEEEDYDYDS